MKNSLLIVMIFCTLIMAGIISPHHTEIQYYGRVDKSNGSNVKYAWPGVHFEFNFTGTSLTLHFEEDENRYEVIIDGEHYPILTTDKQSRSYLISDYLSDSHHNVLIHRRTEKGWGVSTFAGITLDQGGEILQRPSRKKTKIEIIGDSFTTGYGNESESREGKTQIFFETTNTMKAFSAIVGRHYDSDYMVNGYSGLGLVRNAENSNPGKPYGRYYDYILPQQADYSYGRPKKWDFSKWQPDLVIMNFGLNDFSGENVEPADSDQWKRAYHTFIDSLQKRSPGVKIILCATRDWPHDILRNLTKEVVDERTENNSVYYYYYEVENTALHFHPSVSEHETIANGLISLIDEENLLDNSSPIVNKGNSVKSMKLTVSVESKCVNVSFPLSGSYHFSLYTTSGREVFSKQILSQQNQVVSIDLKDLTPGVYLTTILGNGVNTSNRIVLGQ